MKRIYILIPSTYTAQIKNRLLRTYKICMLSRVFANFGITDVIVYYDEDKYFNSHALGKFIVKILNYSITPPKFKKILFPLDEDLKYVYFCPPVELKVHQKEKYKINGILAYKYKDDDNYSYFVGEDKKLYKFKKTFRKFVVIKNNKILDYYTGYWARYYNKSLDSLIRILKKDTFIIGTSKYGKYIKELKPTNKNIAIVFGSPFRGLKEILKKEKIPLYNVVKNQRVETIRLEEAIYYTLEALDLLNII